MRGEEKRRKGVEEKGREQKMGKGRGKVGENGAKGVGGIIDAPDNSDC